MSASRDKFLPFFPLLLLSVSLVNLEKSDTMATALPLLLPPSPSNPHGLLSLSPPSIIIINSPIITPTITLHRHQQFGSFKTLFQELSEGMRG